MQNICLVLEYIGTNYAGFQRQKNGLSIQEVLENAINLALSEKVKVTPSGRTDAGVHAYNQVVNFFTNTTIPVEKLKIPINFYLPKDIRVKSAKAVDLSFNSRKSAKKKTYVYKIYNGQNFSVFDEDRVLYYPYKLDFDLLNKGADLICGTHDFNAFVRSNATTKTTIRTIFSSYFTREGDYIVYHITGNGFLYNMVRILVGTLLLLGRGKLSLDDIKELLNGGNRAQAGKTVSPCGLYLENVEYD